MSKANVREALLIAAVKLFSSNGYNAVSLREIAKSAGANVGSLTYHFGSKAVLLREIYQRHTEPMNARRLELLGEAKRLHDPDERLLAVLRLCRPGLFLVVRSRWRRRRIHPHACRAVRRGQ